MDNLYLVFSVVIVVLVCFLIYVFVVIEDDNRVITEKELIKYSVNPDFLKKLQVLNADGVPITKGKLNEVLEELEKEISDEKDKIIVSQQKEILENLHKID